MPNTDLAFGQLETPQQAPGWILLDDILSAFHQSLQRVEQQMADERPGIRFVVTNFQIDFPVHLDVTDPQRPRVLFPQLAGGQSTSQQAHLTRINCTMSPVHSALFPNDSPSK